MKREISAELFWDKLKTKDWLLEHTSLVPAETYIRNVKRENVPSALRAVMNEEGNIWAVVKPRIGRNGRGIVMVMRTHDDRWRTPTKELGDAGLIAELEHDVLPDYPDRYFVEERFHPHPALKRFTWYRDTIPLFRLLFDHRRGFVVGAMYTAGARAKGFAQILVGGTALWFDEKGVIRPTSDMLNFRGKARNKYLCRTHPDTRDHYKQIEGMSELIELCCEELVPYVTPEKKQRWGVDVAITANGAYRIIEANHCPGCQMANWAGWWPLDEEIKGGFLNG